MWCLDTNVSKDCVAYIFTVQQPRKTTNSTSTTLKTSNILVDFYTHIHTYIHTCDVKSTLQLTNSIYYSQSTLKEIEFKAIL